MSETITDPNMVLLHLPLTLSQHSPTIARDVMQSYELASLRMDQEPTDETQFIHQEIQARFFSGYQPNDRCLIFHGLGSGKCVHPDTLIQTSQGSMTMEQLWLTFSDLIIKDPESLSTYWATLKFAVTVQSYDLDKESFCPGAITALYKQWIHEPVMKITLANQRHLMKTQKHRVWTQRGWATHVTLDDAILCEDDTWSKIIQMETVDYMGDVYDMEIYHHHTYIANGLVTHNTCTAALIHERFKELLISGAQRPPALVIVPNRNYISQYESQIFNVCAKDTYIINLPTIDPEEPMLAGEQRRDRIPAAIHKALRESYVFYTIDGFYKKIKSSDDASLLNQFSNRDIIIDEAHQLHPFLPEYHRFTHVVQNSRIFLLSGTPIWDKATELPRLYNLLLPLDRQFKDPPKPPPKPGKRPQGEEAAMPGRKKKEKVKHEVTQFIKEYYEPGTSLMKPEKRQEFKDRIRGLTSYLRTKLPGTKIQYMGRTQPFVQYYPIVPCVMSEFQAAINRKVWSETPSEEGERDEPAESSSVLRGPREAATFVFPDGTYGTGRSNEAGKTPKAFLKYIDFTNTGVWKYKSGSVLADIRDHLSKYSAKFHTIVEGLKANPNEVTIIFVDNVQSGGGAINLGLILASFELEFQWALKPRQISTPRQPDEPRRFVVFSSIKGTTNSDVDQRRMIDLISRPENRYGDYCSVIIMSKKTATGVDIKNVRRFYQIMPYWNLSLPRQAAGRSERAGGHVSFPLEERYIKHNMLVAVYPGQVKGKVSLKTSIDLYIHRMAEQKDYKNSDALRAAIESAWDCALTYKRNIPTHSTDDSPECFYQSCNYYCDAYDRDSPDVDTSTTPWTYTSDATTMDYSNYMIYHSHSDIQTIKTRLKALFHHYFALPLNRIYTLIEALPESTIQTFIVLEALQQLISQQDPILNRYGQINYLREQSNWFYLVPSMGLQTRFTDTTMASSPLLLQSMSLQHVLTLQAYESDRLRIDSILTSQTFTREAIESLHYDSIIALIEIGIQQYGLGPTFQELYPQHIRSWHEGEYSWAHNLRTLEYHHRGFPPHSAFKPKSKPEDIPHLGYRILDADHGMAVWTFVPSDLWAEVNTLFTHVEQETTSQEATGRRPKDVTLDEIPQGVFGFINKDKKFSIRRIEGPGQKVTKGAVCMEGGWTMKKLLDLLIDLKFYPHFETEVTQKDMAKNLQRSYEVSLNRPMATLQDQVYEITKTWKTRDQIDALTHEQLATLMAIHNTQGVKATLCQLIQRWLESRGLVLEFTQF